MGSKQSSSSDFKTSGRTRKLSQDYQSQALFKGVDEFELNAQKYQMKRPSSHFQITNLDIGSNCQEEKSL
jgi:hypothetical protein